MLYFFDTVELGECALERCTAGKHGFGLRKVFCVFALRQPSLPRRTFMYVNNAVGGVNPVELSDDTLCRIAIAQFLAGGDAPVTDREILDLAIPPYGGHVSRSNGARLRAASALSGAASLSAQQ